MSTHEGHPPPGAPYSPHGQAYPPPGQAYPPPGQAYPPPGPAYGQVPSAPLPPQHGAPPPFPGFIPGAAHKPGAVPLRPLRLGDVLDAAFKVIRHNPQATVGAAVLFSSLAMALPVAVVGLSLPVLDFSADDSDLTDAQWAGLLGTLGSLVVGALLQTIGLVLASGMVAHVTMAATLGRRLSLGQAWAATHGRRWRLIGLAVAWGLLVFAALAAYVGAWVLVVVTAPNVWLVVAWGVVTVPAVVVLASWAWIRLYFLAVPVLMLEKAGVLGSMTRSMRLSRGQGLRLFGIALLTLVLAQVAGTLLSTPVAFLSLVPSLMGASAGTEIVVQVLTQALSTVLVAAFTAPFTSAVAALLYIDMRIRKEAFDVDLMTRAGITPR